MQKKVNILNGANREGNKTVDKMKNEEKIKEKTIVEHIQNPTEEIKKSVIEQIPVEQKENIIEEEIEIIKNELKKDPKFIQMCQNRAMSENEKLEELEMQIENLKGKKNYIEESIAELELHHKKQRKQLAEEFEKEKQKLIQREIKIMEYMDIGLSKIEESEKIDLNKEKSRDDYDLEL